MDEDFKKDQFPGAHYASSSIGGVNDLEKENEHGSEQEQERFFNATDNDILSENLTAEIDNTTVKLKSSKARVYSITINPGNREMEKLSSNEQLKEYTRELMKFYASCFHWEIDGIKVQRFDIKYFGKLETQRDFKDTDWQVKENLPYASQILELKNQQRKIQRGAGQGSIKHLQKQLDQQEQQVPHKIDGVKIIQDTPKPGTLAHIHIIVSRKDASNRYPLSPGSTYKSSEVVINWKLLKRSFDGIVPLHPLKNSLIKNFSSSAWRKMFFQTTFELL